MFFKLFILFALVPISEIYLLIRVGGVIGAFNTILIIFITATLGAYLAKSQGFQILHKINVMLSQGKMPSYEILEGVCILLGAFALLTPGFLTDMLGFSMLIPSIRLIYIKLITNYLNKQLELKRKSTHQ